MAGCFNSASCIGTIITLMEHAPLVGVVMGSKSDYEVLSAAVEVLRALEIPHEARIVRDRKSVV